MHVLFFHGHPIVRSQRWQRLCMAMAVYSPEDQQHMHITTGTADVPLLT